MANERNKIVQNYCLEQLRQIWPDDSEIWTARHKVLKKCFTLKRLKYRTNEPFAATRASSGHSKLEDPYERLMRITNMMKRLNLSCAPRCQKMIKTSSHLYVVYDEFPPLTLKDYLAREKLQMLEKWQIMQNLAKALMEAHSQQIVILGMALQNIYLNSNYEVFFGDWGLCRNVALNESIAGREIPQNYELIAKEVRQLGIYGYWSDVFTLGKLFMAIEGNLLAENMTAVKKRLHDMIERMVSKDVHGRPGLQEVLSFFTGKDAEQNQPFTIKTCKSFEEERASSITLNKFKVKQIQSLRDTTENESIKTVSRHANNLLQHNFSQFHLQSPSPIRVKTQYSCKQLSPFDEVSTPMRTKPTANRLSYEQKLSSLRMSKNSEKVQNDQESYKAVCQKRNLAFLLLDLSEFVIRMEICPELAYLLLKRSLLCLKEAVEDETNRNARTFESQRIVSIMKQQFRNISDLLNKLKASLDKESVADGRMKRQLQDKAVDQNFLKEKIFEFAKGVVLVCENNVGKSSSYASRLSQVLFKTVLILKEVEEGSYQLFWKKVNVPDFAFLSGQKYLREEKSLGYRYLKSKIAEVLNKKR